MDISRGTYRATSGGALDLLVPQDHRTDADAGLPGAGGDAPPRDVTRVVSRSADPGGPGYLILNADLAIAQPRGCTFPGIDHRSVYLVE